MREGSFLDNRNSDHVAMSRAFNDAAESIREAARSSIKLDDETKALILEALDVSVDDLKSDILDRGVLYAGQNPKEQIRTFLRERIEALSRNKRHPKQERALLDFLKEIATPDNA